MNTNDEKILNLKKQVDDRRKGLGVKRQFAPVTSCSIELYGQRYNLNVSSKDTLNFLLVLLHSLEMSQDDLDFSDPVLISGFTIQDWISDIKSKLDVLARRDKEAQLKELEKKLDALLSADKKTELELDSIAELLK